MDILIKILQLILSLSILVFIHELGHFTFARIFKIRVDKFYMFFNPTFSIVRFKKINGHWQSRWFSRNLPDHVQPKLDTDGNPILDKKGNKIVEAAPLDTLPDNDWRKHPETTEWGIGWLPLGGYCKIAGMIDESMDKEQMKQPPKTWEFRSKPAWQRFFVMIGGVTFNVILAMLIYWITLFKWGDDYVANKDVKYGIVCSPLAEEIGFRNGDKILALDGEPVDKFNDVLIKILRDGVQTVKVQRKNNIANIAISNEDVGNILRGRSGFIGLRTKACIDSVLENNPAAIAGLKSGDEIIGVDSVKIAYYDEFVQYLKEHNKLLYGNSILPWNMVLNYIKNKDLNPMQISVLRNGQELTMPIKTNDAGLIGVSFNTNDIKLTHVDYGFFEAFPAGIKKGYNGVRDYIKDLGLMFRPKVEGYKQVGSFVAIGSIFPDVWIWKAFWALTAMLSIMLAVMNILPIPALDGGHVLFLLYEIIFRRKPSDKFLEYAQMVGMTLILMLFIYAMGNDILNFVL